MALTSETQSSPNGVNCIDQESADLIDEKDLEDGEIFEDEDPETEIKTDTAQIQEKPKPLPVANPVATLEKKTLETDTSNKYQEKLDKPKREPPFFNKGKRKFLDDDDEGRRWKREEKRNRRNFEPEKEGDGQGEEEEDMMCVRGASPPRQEDEEKWDQRGEDVERDPREGRRTARTFRRGGGAVSRRGERIRGRGRGRGGIRGTKRKRDEPEMCHFFLQGKCHKGSDCTYSHEILPPRKLELCKFFMKDCCAKKDKCLFLHSEFPCKYYHTGLKCYANKKCKFNHGPLTDQLNKLLAKHLDSCPKDIAGGDYSRRDRNDMRDRMDSRDFRDHGGDLRDRIGDPRERGDPRDRDVDPRDQDGDHMGDSRDRLDRGGDRPLNPRDRGDMRDRGMDPRDRGDVRERGVPPRDRGDFRDSRGGHRDRAMRDSREGRKDFNRNRQDRERNDPTMFDLRLNMNDDMKNSDGSHTPMPSPTQNSQDSMRSSDRGLSIDKETRKDKDRERDKEHDKERDFEREQDHERHKNEKAERREERRLRKEKSREHRKERKERREKRKESHKEKSTEKTDFSEQETDKSLEQLMPPTHPDDNTNSATKVPSQDSVEDCDKKNGLTDEDGLPQHLPKKQRELFLRIQQQQREAENSQENDEDEEDENKDAEENWYSSDEEITPATSLPSVLKNLTQTSSTTNTTSTTSSAAFNPLLNLLASAAAAKLPTTPPTAQIPAQAPIIPTNLDLSDFTSVFEALKNLQSMSAASTTVTSQPQTTPVPVTKPTPEIVAPAAIPEVGARTPEASPVPARVRDPRLRSDVGFVDLHRNSLDGHSSDTDLRQKKLPQPPSSPVGGNDMDLRNLPFKPVQHTAACEIDASIGSHSPINWLLVPASIIKPDYASLLIQPKPGINDPRLRRVARPVTDDVSLPRDPRQRLVEEPTRDPRARPPLLATPTMPPSPLYAGPPATPRYDEDHRPAFYRMDSDMRQFPPPTPRLEDEPYTPGPTRPVDPRQRHTRPDDVDLRPQLTHRVPFMSFK